MRIRAFVYFLTLAVFLTGCGVSSSSLNIFSTTATVSMKQANSKLAQAFPIDKKEGFGTVQFKRALLAAPEESTKLLLSVKLSLTSFEIPEGIDGVMNATASLRYNPTNRTVHLVELVPQGVKFSNNPLSKYVTNETRRALSTVAMQALTDITIHQLKSSFSAKSITGFIIEEESIVISFGS